MNRNEATAYLRSDEDDPDYLRDKPMGRCPWCDSRLNVIENQNDPYCVNWGCPSYHPWESELSNRARYQEERMAAAKIEEKSP